MTTEAGLSDREAVQHLLQFWFAYTHYIKTLIEASHDLIAMLDGENVMVSKEPLMTVTRSANEYDVRGDRNRGYTVFSMDADGLMLCPTCEQLRLFMVKSLNWGTLDKHVFRPLMLDKNRFDMAALNLRDIRVE